MEIFFISLPLCLSIKGQRKCWSFWTRFDPFVYTTSSYLFKGKLIGGMHWSFSRGLRLGSHFIAIQAINVRYTRTFHLQIIEYSTKVHYTFNNLGTWLNCTRFWLKKINKRWHISSQNPCFHWVNASLMKVIVWLKILASR